MFELRCKQKVSGYFIYNKMRTESTIIYNWGINDYPKAISVKGKHFKSYETWANMVRRCYCEKYHKTVKSYMDCEIWEYWKYYSAYKLWYDNNYIEGYHMDKDILFKGNKIYSPDKCSFVPKEINLLVLKSEKARGKYPIGVCWNNAVKKYVSILSINGKKKYLGKFDTPKEAFEVYKIAKEAHVKKIAKEYYSNGLIAENVYIALLAWEVLKSD